MFSAWEGERENGHISLCEGSVDKDRVGLQMMKHRERNTTPTQIPKHNRETDSMIMATADSAVRSLSEVEKYLNSRNEMVITTFFPLCILLHIAYAAQTLEALYCNRQHNAAKASICEHLLCPRFRSNLIESDFTHWVIHFLRRLFLRA